MPLPPATTVEVIGPRIAPPGVALAASAAMSCRTAGLCRREPVRTTSAGAGRPGNCCWISLSVRTTGRFDGRSMAGEPSRIPSAGAPSASSAITPIPPQATGRRTTRCARPAHSRDDRALVRRRPSHGRWPRSAHGPSQDSSAGRNVTDPRTVTPTTMIVPAEMPVKISRPDRNNPASEIITVTPEMTMARPEVLAAMRSAAPRECPAARSSRSRRR